MHTIFDNHQVIAVDCDDVLSETITFALASIDCKVTQVISSINEITDYYLVNVSDEIKRSDAVEFFHQAFELDRNLLSIPPLEGAIEVLQQLKSQGKELHVVTARTSLYEEYTRNYIKKHFPNIFRDVHLGDHHTENHKNKSDICKEIGATLLIDDSMEYCLECAANNIDSILIERPWNKNRNENHNRIFRISSWLDLQ